MYACALGILIPFAVRQTINIRQSNDNNSKNGCAKGVKEEDDMKILTIHGVDVLAGNVINLVLFLCLCLIRLQLT